MRGDAFDAIGADLSAAAREKRRHFVPALVGVSALIVALVAMAGVRDDFGAMPLWRQLALGTSWIVCGLLFPAVGIGLYFPRPSARIVLVAAGLVLPLAGLVGWPLGHEAPKAAAPCGIALVVLASGLVGIGALSGAFAQRRAKISSAWVAAGLTLAALSTTTWICPVDEVGHMSLGHILPGGVLTAVAIALGRRLHARQRR